MKKLITWIGFLVALHTFAGSVTKPNILFIMSDDHSPNAISCYGNKTISTPGIDRLARGGMRFEHALTPNSFCTPARAALLTGKYSHINGTTHLNQKFDGSQQTYPKLFQRAGYQTALFGKWHLLTQPTGFDHYCVMKMQGMVFDPTVWETGEPWVAWEPRSNKWQEGGRKLSGYNVDVITDEALNWLENRDRDKPFCMLLHPKPPHAPYQPAPRYEDFLADALIPEPVTLLDDYAGRTPEVLQDVMKNNRLEIAPQFQDLLTEEQKRDWTGEQKLRHIYQEYMKGYYRLVMSVDDNITRVLDYLEKSGLEESTIVIYTSDNGFFLGEHGFYNKQWMYEPSLHVPLIIKYPPLVKANTVNSSMINHIDMAPTLLDLAGLPVPSDMQGLSLKPVLERRQAKVRDSFYYHFYRHNNALPDMIGVRTEDHKLVHYPGQVGAARWELFDLKRDADEVTNVFANPEYMEVRRSLENELKRLAETYQDPIELIKK